MIFHSDRGSEYSSYLIQKMLRENDFIVSMSGKGNCWDNAVVESFFKTLKTELINRINKNRVDKQNKQNKQNKLKKTQFD